jgi:DNA-binding NtrC family response regulator
LGLSIVFGVVKQSCGYIFVDSQLGRGTTFRIYLPRIEPPPTPKAAVSEPIRGGTETILLVEDAEGVRETVSDFLVDVGYRVLKAADPAGALALLSRQKEPVHLLLTDLVLPGMNGRELASQVKVVHPEMRALYMSGYTDRGSPNNDPVDCGADFLQKPFTMDRLAHKLREILERGADAQQDDRGFSKDL